MLKEEASWKLFYYLMPLIMDQETKKLWEATRCYWVQVSCPSARTQRGEAWWFPSPLQIHPVLAEVQWANTASAPENEGMRWSRWTPVHSQQITPPNAVGEVERAGWKLCLKYLGLFLNCKLQLITWAVKYLFAPL